MSGGLGPEYGNRSYLRSTVGKGQDVFFAVQYQSCAITGFWLSAADGTASGAQGILGKHRALLRIWVVM
jgi:hypothetical protein